jgi:hypothetical protein
VEGDFKIGYHNYPHYGNRALSSLSGLDALENVGGDLTIADNDSLVNLSGLNTLTTIEGSLAISGNERLEDLTGINNLNHIGGGLFIGQFSQYSNPSLTSLDGLGNLSTVGASLRINSNPSLESIAPLLNVTSIGNFLEIRGNEVLSSLSGLDNIDPNTIESVTILYNSQLTECDVESICDFLNLSGNIVIGSNSPGCNSVEEVGDACEFILIGNQNHPIFTLHPNPNHNGIITLTLGRSQKNLQLACINIFGQLMHRQHITDSETAINVSSWPPGLYLAVVYEDGKALCSAKFVASH